MADEGKLLGNFMTEGETRRRRLTLLQMICVVSGGAILALGLVADRLGFGQPGGFGSGQLLLVLTGLFAVLIGLLGQRVVNLYRGVAIILLNTLVLLACLELGAIIITRSGILPSYRQTLFATYQDMPYYTGQDWAEVYWHEAQQAENYRYEPYVVWRHLPFEGETIKINREGIRQTPGADCSRDAYKVFTFGGSTMWAWGSPDWLTITAYLQQGLQDVMGQPVCVINLGEDGFVSTQSVIELITQLQSGNVPNAVIFYDGVNDVFVAYESGLPGVHPKLKSIAAMFDEREHPLIAWLKGSRQYALAKDLVFKRRREGTTANPQLLNYQSMGIDTGYLADSVADVYLSNYKIVGGLAYEYGFDYFFFWQPNLAVGDKILTEDEQMMRLRMDPALVNLADAVYQNIASVDHEYDRIWYIADVFDEQQSQIWIDRWGHVTPEGNRLVAQEMIALMGDHLAQK